VDRPRDDFDARADRWRSDLTASLTRLYDDPEAIAARILGIARAAYDARPAELHDLDRRRLDAPDWFQRSDALGYAAYADRFGDTLEGVARHVDHLTSLGVTYLHLMPLLTPRPAPNDGGYAVADYTTVRDDLGDTDDLRELATTLRNQGISLCIDLVLNHTAREHAWAQAARDGDAEKRDYYLVYPDRHEPDRYEQSLPEVFPDFAPGNFTWDEDLTGWVWTTFNDYQWDLNWANPSTPARHAAPSSMAQTMSAWQRR
jgi:amylosucrase